MPRARFRFRYGTSTKRGDQPGGRKAHASARILLRRGRKFTGTHDIVKRKRLALHLLPNTPSAFLAVSCLFYPCSVASHSKAATAVAKAPPGEIRALGQTPRPALERGKIEELKGLTKVFVGAPRPHKSPHKSPDKSLIKRVTLTIQKQLPELTFVTSPAEAEIWLWVYAGTNSETTRIPPDLSTPPNEFGAQQTRLSSEEVLAVRGSVSIRRAGTLRLIMEVSKTGGGKNLMAEQFAKEFIRAYQKAMGSP